MSNISFISAPSTTSLVSSIGANIQEKGWEKVVAIHAGVGHPLSSMRQGTNDLNRRLPNAAIVTTTTQMKGVWGQNRVFEIRGPIGGFGTQGSSIRVGKGVPVKSDTWELGTGVHWHGVNWDNVAMSQTIQGRGDKDAEAQQFLKGHYGWLTGNFLQAELHRAVRCGPSGTDVDTSISQRCVLYAGNKTAVSQLRSSDTLKLSDLTRLENTVSENGAEGFSLTVDGGYNDIQEYLIMAPHTAFDALTATDEWTNLQASAGVRGDKNVLFSGGLTKHRGSSLFQWKIQTSQADGPTGALSAPQAYLGEAIAAGSAAFTIKGGGNSRRNKAALNAPYFIHFENAGFTAFQQTKLARDTSTVRYIRAYNATTNQWAFASYKVIAAGDINDASGTIAPANTLTIFKMLSATNAGDALNTIGGVTWNTGVWGIDAAHASGYHCEWSDLPVGSKIYQCNEYGVCYNIVEALGRHTILDGYGKLPGGNEGMGQRTQEIQNHGVFAEIGMQMSYGANMVPNMDGLPSAAIMYVAINPPGSPVIE